MRSFQAERHEHAYLDRHCPFKLVLPVDRDSRGRACKKPGPGGSKDEDEDEIEDGDQGKGKVLC